MGTLAERLQLAIKDRGTDVSKLARGTKLSRAAIHLILSGTTKPESVRASTVNKLCHELGISRDWLLYGRGSMRVGVPEVLQASQNAGLDLATLRGAKAVLELLDGFLLGPTHLWQNETAVKLVYDHLASTRTAVGDDNLVAVAKQVVTALRAELTSSNDPTEK